MTTPPQPPQYGADPRSPQPGAAGQGTGHPGPYPHPSPHPQQQFPQSYPGPPDGQFPPPPGAPSGPVTSTGPRVLIAVLLVLVVGLGIFLFIQNKRNDPTAAAVGDCLKVEGTTTTGNPESEQIDCTDPDAQFTVTETGAGASCDRLELSYVQYRSDDRSAVAGTVCLRPHFEVGECYVPPAEEDSLPRVGPCDSVDASTEVKVESINPNTSDTSVCSTPKLSYTYTRRDEVVCFSPAS